MLPARCVPLGHPLLCQDAPWSDWAEAVEVGGVTDVPAAWEPAAGKQ